jgi:hypothetical protein
VSSALAALVRETVRTLDEHGLQSHGIEGAALLTTALQEVGIAGARPLTVGVTILNPAYWAFVKAYGPPRDEVSPAACHDAGGAIVVLGKGADPVSGAIRPGHLVVIVPGAFGGNDALLDPTITQADRPDWGIHRRPLCLKVSDDLVSGRSPANFEVNGSLLRSTSDPEDRGYGDWGQFLRRDDIDRAAAAVVSRLGSRGSRGGSARRAGNERTG